MNELLTVNNLKDMSSTDWKKVDCEDIRTMCKILNINYQELILSIEMEMSSRTSTHAPSLPRIKKFLKNKIKNS